MTGHTRTIPLLIFLLSLSIAGFSQNQGIEFFHGSMDEAKVKAKEENKLIFVDAYTVWCGPCRWMANNVFSHPKVGEFFNKHFINVKLNMETAEGSTFGVVHQVRGYPTFVFINSKDKEFHRVMGAQPVDRFLSAGKQVVTEAKVKARMYMPDDSERSE